MLRNKENFNSTKKLNSTESLNTTELVNSLNFSNSTNNFNSSEPLGLNNFSNYINIQGAEQIIFDIQNNELSNIGKKENNLTISMNSTNIKVIIEAEKLQFPSSASRDYRYLELNNELKVILISDIYDMEMGIGIQYPMYLLNDCKELGGHRLLSNVFVNGLKDYFQDFAILKYYFIDDSRASVYFSTTEDQYQILDYLSKAFESFNISFEGFLDAYLKTVDEFLDYNDDQITNIVNMLIKLAHHNSYLSSSCSSFSSDILDANKNTYELVQLRKKIVKYIRNNISSNLLTLIISVPNSLDSIQAIVSNTLGGIKNYNAKIPDIYDDIDYGPAFTNDNLIGKKLINKSFSSKGFFFCFMIDDNFSANVLEVERVLKYLFINKKNSLAFHLNKKNLNSFLKIRIFLHNKSPILSLHLNLEEDSKLNPADVLGMIRQVTYTYTESPLLEKHIINYFHLRKAKYQKILSTHSTTNVVFTLFDLINNSPLEDISNINAPETLLDSVTTVLDSCTFSNFFLIETFKNTENLSKNKIEFTENIELNFWNSVNADLISSFSLEEPEENKLVPKTFGKIVDNEQYFTEIKEIDFRNDKNESLLTPYHDRISFGISNGFQRPSSLVYFKMNLVQDEYFSIKSILFKCFIAFVMNIFLKPYKNTFLNSSVNLEINCGFDNFNKIELIPDSLSIYTSSYSEVFPNLLNLISESFNNATSLDMSQFSNFKETYRMSIIEENNISTGIYHANSIVNSMLNTDYPSYSNYLAIIERANFQDYVKYCKSLLGFNNIKGLISGNINSSISKIELSKFIQSLNLGDLDQLEDPYDYNLPKLIVCYNPNMPRHYLLKREQINEMSQQNLVFASVFLEDSIKNVLILTLVNNLLIKLIELAETDKVDLDFNWHIEKHYIRLNISSISTVRFEANVNLPIVEYTTDVLKLIYDLSNNIDLKLKTFSTKAKRVITIKSIDEETRFKQLYIYYMKNKVPYSQQNLLKEFEKLTAQDISKFIEEFKNSLTYLIVISSKNQTNKDMENEITGFTFTNGYPNVD